MAGLRIGTGAAMLTWALWRGLRALLIMLALLLGADLFAGVLVAPAMLLGPAGGIPITVVALVLCGYAARKLIAVRRSTAERRLRLERQWAQRRRKERQWARRLHWLERTPGPDRIGYREAAPDLGYFGYCGGLGIGSCAFIVAYHNWPHLVKSLPVVVVLVAPLVVCPLVGFGVVVLYRVHLHHLVGPRVAAWRRRRLRGRLAWSAANRSAVAMDPAMADPFGDVGSFDDGGDLGDYSDSGGSDSGD